MPSLCVINTLSCMVHLYLEVADQLKLDLRRVLWLVLAVLQNPYLYLNRIELAFNNGKC
jgi:hypothetical protein